MSRYVSVGSLVIIATLIGLSCNIETSGPGGTPNSGIPFVYQENGDYCVPATIQMSARFYSLSPPSQAFLFQDMNGYPGGGGIGGVSLQYIAPELARYGGIGDAVMDNMYFTDNTFLKRQIGAATYPSPVVALINQGYHAGVINGGSWNKTFDANGNPIYNWLTLHFHDPSAGPNIEYVAGTWASVNCGSGNPVCYQALSNSLAALGPQNSSGVTVAVYGGGGEVGGGGPKEY